MDENAAFRVELFDGGESGAVVHIGQELDADAIHQLQGALTTLSSGWTAVSRIDVHCTVQANGRLRRLVEAADRHIPATVRLFTPDLPPPDRSSSYESELMVDGVLLSIERQTDSPPDDGMFHVLHEGSPTGRKFRRLARAQDEARKLGHLLAERDPDP